MTLTEKLNLLMSEEGINRAELARESGIPYTTLSSFYDKGTDNVKLSTLRKLAEYFECTLDYLVDDNVTEPKNNEPSNYNLTYNEYEHIKSYRQISATGQQCIDNMTNSLIDYEQAFKTQIQALDEVTATKETIQVYLARAAAGIPLPIVADGYDLVDRDVSVPINADFGVVLSGDSMEPDYPDGSTVWVKAQKDLEHGDVGVFMVNGETTCKEFYSKDGVCKLVSLNKKYDDIVINEHTDIRTAGKVIGHN